MINYKKTLQCKTVRYFLATYEFIAVHYINITDIVMQSNMEACDADVNDSHD